MDDEDPIRLKQGAGAPPSLVRALEALRKGADETARLERVAGKLGPLLDAPAPSMPAKPSVGSASFKLTALKLLVAGLVLLAPVLWMMRRDGSAKPQKAQAPNEVTSVAKPPEPAATKPIVPPQPKAEPAVPPPDVSSAQRRELAPANRDRDGDRDRAEGRGQKADARRMRGQVEGAPAIAASGPSESSADGASADGARASETAREQSARAAEPSSPTPSPTPTPTPSATQATAAKADAPSPRPPPSEAQLLFAARKAMPDDPALALRLLTDHQRHYPEGVFVPEREVLAIEALRGLGRTAEANARLRLFKARYPNSFHLQRLEK